MIDDKVLILSFVWMLSPKLLGSQNCQGWHRGLRLALVSAAPAEVHPEPVVSNQQQEGPLQSSRIKQLLWCEEIKY